MLQPDLRLQRQKNPAELHQRHTPITQLKQKWPRRRKREAGASKPILVKFYAMAHDNFDLRFDPACGTAEIVILSHHLSGDGTISITSQCAKQSEFQWHVDRLKRELDELAALARTKLPA
jgi:hypothetical protein